jgi:hypothetical protein
VAAAKPNLSIDEVWNTVALEERLELISRSHAQGAIAASVFMVYMGAVAYGFDQIWLLPAALFGAMLVFSLFSTYVWRRGKPQLILSYLAVRSVARRYAYGYGIPELDVILIFRGQMREIFEEGGLAEQKQAVDLDSSGVGDRDVWICLLRGAVMILSERPGGAKLDFVSQVSEEIECRKPTAKDGDDLPDRTIIVHGAGISRGRRVALFSRYAGALYVFEKQLQGLIFEHRHAVEKLENLRKAEIRAS